MIPSQKNHYQRRYNDQQHKGPYHHATHHHGCERTLYLAADAA